MVHQDPIPPKTFESRLIPILREGVETTKLILYARLRPTLDERHQDLAPEDRGRLAAAVVNELFATPNPDPAMTRFLADHHPRVDAELDSLATTVANLRILLTDALRTQYCCDRIEEIDPGDLLGQAHRLGILVQDRELPMPARFIHLVRTIGAAYGILAPGG